MRHNYLYFETILRQFYTMRNNYLVYTKNPNCRRNTKHVNSFCFNVFLLFIVVNVIAFIGIIFLKYMETISPVTVPNQVENSTDISLAKEIQDSFIPDSTQAERTHTYGIESTSQNDNVISTESKDITKEENISNQTSNQQERVSIQTLPVSHFSYVE